ncbi:hypothetical protein E1293_38915 [Actinomadura darangshiensis]|uniref:WD40 repeat domain-containing protein n=1 Tax=Actinomadura darangshiensis TaxID=705336 RepID=A0A4R5A465_9ACTN|nr:hypothetical protein [Actinomadura darangshiensis]TDD66661.1 hypothetical protein E1293_38915 [Actinomadura darangshiensis]
MPDEPNGREPISWRIRRWAAPFALALSVAASIGAVQLFADGDTASALSHDGRRMPRFTLAAGRMGGTSSEGGPTPWFQVSTIQQDKVKPVDSVPPPSSAGSAQAILAGPHGTFAVSSLQEKACESRLYRFGLTGDGHVKEIEPLSEDVIPARADGLAISPDGDRIAYATTPCTNTAEPRATVTVMDIGSGHRRTWTTAAPSVVGEIVWARDDHTLGYTLSDVRPATGRPGAPYKRDVGNVTVHALDTAKAGTDLRAGRVLFRQPAGPGAVTSAVMNPDGRTGYGTMKAPSSIMLFSFTAGKPMKVTKTIRVKPNTLMVMDVVTRDGPRYACLDGLDAFGRVVEGGFMNSSGGSGCTVAYAY